MYKIGIYALLGYLSGSVLFARVSAALFHKKGILEESGDHNPGTANAFHYGGLACGLLTLAGDILKGFAPVFLCARSLPDFYSEPLFALAAAAPVLGHAFPVFHPSKGGKGIAVSFGCLFGLLPEWRPVVILAACFLFFSLILVITPNLQRTFVTYLCAAVWMLFLRNIPACSLGFALICGIVCLRLHMSKERRELMEVRPVWMH